MSQKKVDQYKEYKKNREQILAKEKRVQKIWRIAGIVVAALLVLWLGFSIYNSVTRAKEDEETAAVSMEWDVNEYMEYLGSLQSSYAE